MFIFENKTFNTVKGVGDDCLHLDGVKAQIKDCIFSRKGYLSNEADELLGVVNGSKVKVYTSLFEYNGKGVLIGTGDNNEEDVKKGQSAYFYRCAFKHLSRRSIMANAGEVVLEECVIYHWGDDEHFHTKSYGGRASGKFANVTYINCIFIQESLWKCLARKNFWKDLVNNLTWPPKGLGFMRGAWSDQGGKIRCVDCYKNRWWIILENSEGTMSENDADALLAEILHSLQDC